jgi:hypothetical protein
MRMNSPGALAELADIVGFVPPALIDVPVPMPDVDRSSAGSS